MTTPAPRTDLFVNAEDSELVEAGTTIFKVGEPGRVMFVVQEGEIDLLVNDVTVETVGPGGMFGELALIDQEPRSTAAIARTDCRLVAVDQTRFMMMLRQTPFFAIHVLKVMAHRLRATDARLGT